MNAIKLKSLELHFQVFDKENNLIEMLGKVLSYEEYSARTRIDVIAAALKVCNSTTFMNFLSYTDPDNIGYASFCFYGYDVEGAEWKYEESATFFGGGDIKKIAEQYFTDQTILVEEDSRWQYRVPYGSNAWDTYGYEEELIELER